MGISVLKKRVFLAGVVILLASTIPVDAQIGTGIVSDSSAAIVPHV